MKFYIYSPNYQKGVGGIRVLHKLNNILSELKIDSEIVYFGSDKNIGHEQESFVIYPEVVKGNPLNGKNVIRWLLNSVGVIDGDESTWNEDDLVFKYLEIFNCKDTSKVINKLTILDIDWESIKSNSLNIKEFETCHLIKKGKYYFEEFAFHPIESIELDSFATDYDRTIEVISRCKKLISYDNESFYSLIAPMLGTISIIIPKDSKTQEEFSNQVPFARFGISYGLENESHSKNTMSFTKDLLEIFENNNFENTKNFMKDCRNYLQARNLEKRLKISEMNNSLLNNRIIYLEMNNSLLNNRIIYLEKILIQFNQLQNSYTLKIGKIFIFPLRLVFDFIHKFF